MKTKRSPIAKLYYYQRKAIYAAADGKKLKAKYYSWRYNRLNNKIYNRCGK